MLHHSSRAALALLFFAAAVMAQNAVPSTTVRSAAIEGIATSSETRQPLSHVLITISAAAATTQQMDPSPRETRGPLANRTAKMAVAAARTTSSVLTDASGRFRVEGLAPGSYRILASREGFLAAEYGTVSGSYGRGIELIAGQTLAPEIRMDRASVIAGRVQEASGEPLYRATVQAYSFQYHDGHRSLVLAGSAQADDRGEYRLFWLVPGEYFVAAVPPSETNDALGLPRLFYPGTADLDGARPVVLRAAEEVNGIDFYLRPTSTIVLKGKVEMPSRPERPSSANQSVLVSLTRVAEIPDGIAGTEEPVTVRAGGNGLFEFRGLTPGSYFVTGRAGQGSSELTGRVRVDLGAQDVSDLALLLRPGLIVRGRIVAASFPPQFRMSQLRVNLVEETGGVDAFAPGPAAGVAEDGTFALEGVAPLLDYRVRVDNLDGGYLQEGRIGSSDALARPFHAGDKDGLLQLQVSFAVGRVQGRALDNRENTSAGVQVVLVPDQPRRNRPEMYFSTSTTENGGFVFGSVPAGGYRLFAWDFVPQGAYLFADFLQRFADRGVPVHVDDQGVTAVDPHVMTSGFRRNP